MRSRQCTRFSLGVQELELMGFSGEQIAGLKKIRARYQQGRYDEVDPEYNRLRFIRWLYLQGRLQS